MHKIALSEVEIKQKNPVEFSTGF